jgi:hypothetical protein
MPTIKVNGRPVQVGDEFLSLSPEDQDKTVDHISKQMAPPSQWENFKTGIGAIIQDPSLALGVGPAKMVTDAAKSAVSGFTLPADVYSGREPMALPTQMTAEQGKRVADMATFGPMNPAVRAGSAWMPTAKQVIRPGETRATADLAPAAVSRELPGLGAPVLDMQVTERVAPPTVSYEPTLRMGAREPPTAAALTDRGGEQFNQIRAMGVEYRPEAVAKMAQNAKLALEKDALLEENAPQVHSILNKLSSPPPAGSGATAPLESLVVARQSLGKLAQKWSDPTQQGAASRVIKDLDRFIEEMGPGAAVAGPAAEASALYKTARGNYAAGSRSDRITERVQSAEQRAATANSGQNVGNKIRQRVADLLDNPKTRSGFSAEELAALEYVAKGGRIANVSRTIGNLLGGGLGMGANITAALGGTLAGANYGATTGLIAGLAGPLAGVIAKKTSNAMTRRALAEADQMVRARSPLHELAPEIPVAPGTLGQLPTRSLLMLGQQQPMVLNVAPNGYE